MSGPPSGTPEIRRNEADHRYEAWLDGETVGFAFYRQEPGRTVFLHTEVAERMEGRGVGRALVREALDDVRARGEQAVPLCPFVAAYIKGHRDYQDLVPHEYDRAIGRNG
ncbi:MAG: N-acetyltransferase [Candidatus Dormibacteraeota bacterium]|nr:N-acetyltransferase [Candidatus Dormibacteraeota bacterium]